MTCRVSSLLPSSSLGFSGSVPTRSTKPNSVSWSSTFPQGLNISTAPSSLRKVRNAAEESKSVWDKTQDLASDVAGKTNDAVAKGVEETKIRAEGAKASASDAFDKTKDAAGSAVDKTKEAAASAVDGTKEAAGTVADKVKEGASQASENAKIMGEKAAETVEGAWGSTKEAVEGAAKTVKDTVAGK